MNHKLNEIVAGIIAIIVILIIGIYIDYLLNSFGVYDWLWNGANQWRTIWK